MNMWLFNCLPIPLIDNNQFTTFFGSNLTYLGKGLLTFKLVKEKMQMQMQMQNFEYKILQHGGVFQ